MGAHLNISSYQLMQKIGRFVLRAPGLFATAFYDEPAQSEAAA